MIGGRMWRAVTGWLSLVRDAARHPACAARGAWEFRHDPRTTYDDPWSDRSAAYDCGREMAHRATLRHWDDAHHRDRKFWDTIRRRRGDRV